ncbi:MAG: class I SAM-dependent methyltransferase [Bacteroidota bacterium]
MQIKLFLIRKFKALFIRLKLHVIVEPFSGALLNLAYISKFSKWANSNKISYNDFYSSKWDYEKRFPLYKYISDEYIKDRPITYLEFGVASGTSFLWWLDTNKNPQSTFHGFDTFTGLPEDWGAYKKGYFGGNAIPDTKNDTRAKFYQGLFQQTLPGFVKTFSSDNQLVLMMDADLYSSTLFTLTSMAPFLKKGDLIIFDEFSVPTHEFLAFKNFTESYYLNLKPIGAANNYYFTAFEVN